MLRKERGTQIESCMSEQHEEQSERNREHLRDKSCGADRQQGRSWMQPCSVWWLIATKNVNIFLMKLLQPFTARCVFNNSSRPDKLGRRRSVSVYKVEGLCKSCFCSSPKNKKRGRFKITFKNCYGLVCSFCPVMFVPERDPWLDYRSSKNIWKNISKDELIISNNSKLKEDILHLTLIYTHNIQEITEAELPHW